MNVDHNKVDVLYIKMKWDGKFRLENLKESSFDIFVYIDKKTKEILWAYVELHEQKFATKNCLLLSICDDLNVFWHILKEVKKAKT